MEFKKPKRYTELPFLQEFRFLIRAVQNLILPIGIGLIIAHVIFR